MMLLDKMVKTVLMEYEYQKVLHLIKVYLINDTIYSIVLKI